MLPASAASPATLRRGLRLACGVTFAVTAVCVSAARATDLRLASTEDGPWIAFHADPGASGDLYLDSVDGSHRRRLTHLFGQVPTASWSPDGKRLAFLARPRGVQDVYVINVDGQGLRQLTRDEGDHFGDVSWSPDGRRIAFACCGRGRAGIYLINPDGTGRTKLVGNAGQPVWSPDGKRIAYTSFKSGNPELHTIKPDGSAQRRLTSNHAQDVDPAWSPDGHRIAFTSTRNGKAQIYLMNANGSRQRRLVRDRWSDQRPEWSPDGRIVFTSFRNRDPNLLGIGNAEILVAAADGSSVRNLTRSRFWEGEPNWAPDGKQIAYATRRDFGPCGDFRVGVMSDDGSGKRFLPAVPDANNAGGKANSCCPAWQP
jgi:Tol biopolymer transport system component